LEFDFEDLPLASDEATFGVARECSAGISIASVLEVVVADGELSVGFLDVTLVYDADVTAAEYWTLLWVTGDGELSKIKTISFSEIKRKYERVQCFISRPMFFT
jgi:hypothetical protein